MTEVSRATPENAPALDLGRRVFARHARAEGRLSPWTRRDLAGKAIVREMRFAQHIARRVYGRGAPEATFDGPLSPNAPRGVARFSEKVAERNSLADVARKYAPAEDTETGEAAPKSQAAAPLPLAGGGEGAGARKAAGPTISAAEALQRLAVARPDLDQDASPFAKILKAATGGAKSSEPTLQRAPDPARRVVETFQREPRPRPASSQPAQPRLTNPPLPIQRRADPSIPAEAMPPAEIPPPGRLPGGPSPRAIRRFARVEEVVPPGFTPPSDDFGGDLPEPGGPVRQRATPAGPGEAMPLARRPETAPPPTQTPAVVVQPKRPATSKVAPKRQAKPAPAPARLQRRPAAPGSRPAPQPDRGGPTTGQPPAAPPPAPGLRPLQDASVDAATRTAPAPAALRPAQTETPAEPPDTPPAPGAQPSAPIQRQPGAEAPGLDLPLARPARADETPPAAPIVRQPADDTARDLPVARSAEPAPSPAAPIQRQPTEGAAQNLPPARSAESGPPPAASIERQPAEGPAQALPFARPAKPAPPLAAPMQRPPAEGSTQDLPLAHPAETAPIQRQPSEGAAQDLPLARPTESAPIQRQPTAGAAQDLPLARPAEPTPPLPAAPIQRQPAEGVAQDLSLARPAEPTPPPAAPIQRKPAEGATQELPLARPGEPAPLPPAANIQRQPAERAAPAPPDARPGERVETQPPAPIVRLSGEDSAADMPLVRPPEPTAPSAVQRKPTADGPSEQRRIAPLEPTAAPSTSSQQARSGEGPASGSASNRPAEALPPAAPIQRQAADSSTGVLPLARPATQPAPPAVEPTAPPVTPFADDAVDKPPLRPRASALNLARRAVQRMLGEGPLPLPAAPDLGASSEAPAPSSRDGQAEAKGPRRPVESGAPRPAPIPARIQRAPALAHRVTRGASPSGPNTSEMPLVVPLLAAQSQSASRQIQREPGPELGGAAAVAKSTTSWQRAAPRPPAVKDRQTAPRIGQKPPAPEPPARAKANEPDLNYDLLAQRVYPFIRRLLAFERERERGS